LIYGFLKNPPHEDIGGTPSRERTRALHEVFEHGGHSDISAEISAFRNVGVNGVARVDHGGQESLVELPERAPHLRARIGQPRAPPLFCRNVQIELVFDLFYFGIASLSNSISGVCVCRAYGVEGVAC
jgi:hypothetical protein